MAMTQSVQDFVVGDYVVYPAHGVGQINGVETQEVAGISLEVYIITFDHEKMTLRVPTRKAKAAGLRPLASGDVVSQAMVTLKGRARVKRTMWSRRAQEYEAKINSGDLISIAEVVRDLHRADNQPEQSYSERQLYESALDRMAREVAAIEQIDRDAAIGLLTKSLVKAA
jgi:CarD family transcriptional regulator